MKRPNIITTDNTALYRRELIRLLGLQKVDWKIRQAYNMNHKYLKR